MRSSEARTAAIGLCLLSVTLLAWAVLGKPPYGFFGLMKIEVIVAAGLAAYELFRAETALVPLSLVLVGLGVVEFVGKMRREQWVPWNWAMIAAFAAAAGVLFKQGGPNAKR